MTTAFFRVYIIGVLVLFCAHKGSTEEPNYFSVNCHVETKKDIVKEAKSIEFKLFCGNEDLETVLLPEQFFTQQRIFANSLRFVREDGQELCLMDRRYSRDDRLYRYVPHTNEEAVSVLKFPDKFQEKYRLVTCQDLSAIKPHEIMKMEDLFNVGSSVIPKGTYEVFLKLPSQWQTSHVGHHNLILTQTDDHKTNVGDYDWWSVADDQPAKQLTIK